jgi:hypothetical protein
MTFGDGSSVKVDILRDILFVMVALLDSTRTHGKQVPELSLEFFLQITLD